MSGSNIWMPIYIGDYHRETRHLTAEQHGGYLLLGMEYWSRGSLPDDDKQLARLAGMTGAQWRRNRDTIKALFTDGWKHSRWDAEIARAADLSAKYSDRAKKAAEARHGAAAAAKEAVDSSQNATVKPHREAAVETEKDKQDQGEEIASSNPQAGTKHQKSKSKSDSDLSTDKSERSRGTRLPLDWQPTDDDLAYAKEHGLQGTTLQNESKKFRNYWHTKPGKSATMLDWSKVWQNWVLRWLERAPPSSSNGQGARTPGNRTSSYGNAARGLAQDRGWLDERAA